MNPTAPITTLVIDNKTWQCYFARASDGYSNSITIKKVRTRVAEGEIWEMDFQWVCHLTPDPYFCGGNVLGGIHGLNGITDPTRRKEVVEIIGATLKAMQRYTGVGVFRCCLNFGRPTDMNTDDRYKLLKELGFHTEFFFRSPKTNNYILNMAKAFVDYELFTEKK